MEINITYEGEKYFGVTIVELNDIAPVKDQVKEHIIKLFYKITERVDIDIKQIDFKTKKGNLYATVIYTYRFK